MFGLKAAADATSEELHDLPKKDYALTPDMVMQLGEGTLFVLAAPDDEDFLHEAWWDRLQVQQGSQCRTAIVFRWLSKRHNFVVHGDAAERTRSALHPTAEIAAAIAKRPKERAKKAKRAQGLLSSCEQGPKRLKYVCVCCVYVGQTKACCTCG